MSDIFISYARSSAAQAQQVAETLRALGYVVWRDDEIPANRAYAEVIEERLAKAKAVVVIWSAEAAKSEWVQSEADRARNDRKLVQLSLDAVRLPMPFDRIQCAELRGWAGETDHPGWKQVVGAIAALTGAATAAPASKAAAATRKLSICVLPFSNMSGDPEQEYFSDGVSEDIITDLSKVSALGVIARNTAFTFKGKNVEIPEVARRLGVSHVLEGSIRKAGNRVRITAQLIDGASGEHTWAERWDRDLTDIFALQDEISQAVVAALKVKLLPEEKKAIAQRGTDNVEAYNLYLMARRYYVSMSAKRRPLIIRLCQEAVGLDPGYGRAWALMAVCKAGLARDSRAAQGDGWAEAERALALDPGLAEAHAAKARILLNRGELEAAWTEAEAALALDPDSHLANLQAGDVALRRRRHADAIRFFEAAAAIDEDDGASLFVSLQCHEALGDPDGARSAAQRAIERLEKAVAREPDNGNLLAYGVGALAVLGDADRAHDWARHALLIDPDDSSLRFNLACAMVRLKDVDYALELLGAAFDLSQGGLVTTARNDSDFDPLREDPRFDEIMARGEALLAAKSATNAGG